MPNEYEHPHIEDDDGFRPKDDIYEEYHYIPKEGEIEYRAKDDEVEYIEKVVEVEYLAKADEVADQPTDDEGGPPEEDEVEAPKEAETKLFSPKDMSPPLKEKTVYATASVYASLDNNYAVNVTIPANAAIAKILASIRQSPNLPIDNGELRIAPQASSGFFNVEFNKNPFESVGGYETSFTQPLCVGPEDVAATLYANRGNARVPAQNLKLTVVYCPDSSV